MVRGKSLRGAVERGPSAVWNDARWCEMGTSVCRLERALARCVGSWCISGEYLRGEQPGWRRPAVSLAPMPPRAFPAFEISRRRERGRARCDKRDGGTCCTRSAARAPPPLTDPDRAKEDPRDRRKPTMRIVLRENRAPGEEPATTVWGASLARTPVRSPVNGCRCYPIRTGQE
jgi:hypothetical protein